MAVRNRFLTTVTSFTGLRKPSPSAKSTGEPVNDRPVSGPTVAPRREVPHLVVAVRTRTNEYDRKSRSAKRSMQRGSNSTPSRALGRPPRIFFRRAMTGCSTQIHSSSLSAALRSRPRFWRWNPRLTTMAPAVLFPPGPTGLEPSSTPFRVPSVLCLLSPADTRPSSPEPHPSRLSAGSFRSRRPGPQPRLSIGRPLRPRDFRLKKLQGASSRRFSEGHVEVFSRGGGHAASSKKSLDRQLLTQDMKNDEKLQFL